MYEEMHMKKSCTNIDAGVVCRLHVNNVVSGGLIKGYLIAFIA